MADGMGSVLSQALVAVSRLQSRRAKIGHFLKELLEQHSGEQQGIIREAYLLFFCTSLI